jgi:hypothetical protein
LPPTLPPPLPQQPSSFQNESTSFASSSFFNQLKSSAYGQSNAINNNYNTNVDQLPSNLQQQPFYGHSNAQSYNPYAQSQLQPVVLPHVPIQGYNPYEFAEPS